MASMLERSPPRARGHPSRRWAGVARCVAVLAIVVGLTAGAAVAESVGQVRLKFLNVWPRQAGSTYLNDQYHGTFYAGTYNLKLDPSVQGGLEGPTLVASAAPFNYEIGSYCADLVQDAPGQYAYYDIYRPQDAPIGGSQGGMGPAKAADLRRLFDRHLFKVGPGDHADAAAFQASVWEIVYEDANNAYDVSYHNAATRGAFYIEEYWGGSGWLDTANAWLADLGTDDPDIGLRVLANVDKQDFAVTIPGLGAAPIPEPLTMLGVFLGVGGLGAYVRRRQKTEAP